MDETSPTGQLLPGPSSCSATTSSQQAGSAVPVSARTLGPGECRGLAAVTLPMKKARLEPGPPDSETPSATVSPVY